MIENGEQVAKVAASSTAAPSCYRVSLLSGSLEVSARLKSADDLDLLMRVLEANKALFTKADNLEPQILADVDRPAPKLSTTQSETQALVKADRPKAKTKALFLTFWHGDFILSLAPCGTYASWRASAGLLYLLGLATWARRFRNVPRYQRVGT